MICWKLKIPAQSPGFYLLASDVQLSPDHQTAVLSRNIHRLAGGKAELLQL